MKKGIAVALSAVLGASVGALGTKNMCNAKTAEKQKMSDKHLALFLLMNQWVKVKQEQKDIAQYLEKKGYKKIAIYGMSYVGERLFDELKDSGIETAYAIDKKTDGIYAEIDVFAPDDTLPAVDAVIVTPVFFFEEIKQTLSSQTKADILSLEDILYDI